jgi:hypothetical protein
MQYYVFDTQAEAEAAELYIRQAANAPITGKNAKTNQFDADKAKTEHWAIPQQRFDGKWVFERVPAAICSQYPRGLSVAFNNQFNFIIEEFDDSWFPPFE